MIDSQGDLVQFEVEGLSVDHVPIGRVRHLLTFERRLKNHCVVLYSRLVAAVFEASLSAPHRSDLYRLLGLRAVIFLRLSRFLLQLLDGLERHLVLTRRHVQLRLLRAINFDLLCVDGAFDVVVKSNDDVLEENVAIVVSFFARPRRIHLLLEQQLLCLVEILGDGTRAV